MRVLKAKEAKLPESTLELLTLYGGKDASDDRKTCGFIPVKGTSKKCRNWAIAILLVLLVATGLITFLVFFLAKDDRNNSSSSIEVATPSVSSDLATTIDAEDSAAADDKDNENKEEDEEQDSESMEPPLVVVGVNPIPATNLSLTSPNPTSDVNETISDVDIDSSAGVGAEADTDIDGDATLGNATGFYPDEIEDATIVFPTSTNTTLSGSTMQPSSGTTEDATLSTTMSSTAAVTSSPSMSATLITTLAATSTGTQATTLVPTATSTVAETSLATDDIATITSQPTSAPTALDKETFTPTWPSSNGIDADDVTSASPTKSPTFTSLQSQGDSFLPEDVLLFNFLVENSLDEGAGLRNPQSAQYRAFRWLSGNMYLSTYSDDRRLQRYALATLYFSTGGDSWSNNQYWLSDLDECSYWFSRILEVASDAICNPEKQMLTLDLDYNNLNGTLPIEIGLLSHLRRVELYGGPSAYMSGTLPSQLALLTDLEALSVRGNAFLGTIPSEIGSMINLGKNQKRLGLV